MSAATEVFFQLKELNPSFFNARCVSSIVKTLKETKDYSFLYQLLKKLLEHKMTVSCEHCCKRKKCFCHHHCSSFIVLVLVLLGRLAVLERWLPYTVTITDTFRVKLFMETSMKQCRNLTGVLTRMFWSSLAEDKFHCSFRRCSIVSNVMQ